MTAIPHRAAGAAFLPGRGLHDPCHIFGLQMKTSLTGIQATGTPHLGNYLGAIRPALELTEEFRSFYFIADYHALTTIRDPAVLRSNTYDVAATWLACGLDPEKTVFYRQSSIPEVHELAWIFACLISTGHLGRGTSYKDALSKCDHPETPNAGYLNYPLLMAADIALFGADVVPVGLDQKQHLEVAGDLVASFNHVFGDVLKVPGPHIADKILVPGLDGNKMSKSRGNTIPLFASAKVLADHVKLMVTGSESLSSPKDPSTNSLLSLYEFVASGEEVDEMERKLRAGGYGWGHAKQALVEALESTLFPLREAYEGLRGDEPYLDMVLGAGAEKARSVASETISRVRRAVGIL